MSTPRQLQRIIAVFALLAVAVVGTGCTARAAYVYDEPVYRRERVYRADPPVVVYRDRSYYHAPPRPVYRAPARRVEVYRAPVYRERHSDHDHHHRHHDHDR